MYSIKTIIKKENRVKPYYLKDKLYVGVSGHRDLKEAKNEEYKNQVINILEKLMKENPEKEVIVISPLADGADRLVVYAAKELGLRYEVLLPMPIALYEMDFDDVSFDEFMTLFYEARSSDVIDLCENCTEETIADYGSDRDKQYLKVGQEVVDKSDVMLFLWDKKEGKGLGGTADIVSYAKQKDKSYIIVECERES